MAWVRFPDGSRRKVERVERADAERDLDELLALRAEAQAPGPRRARLVTFGELLDGWVAAGCPTVAPSSRRRHARAKSPKTLENVKYLVERHLRPEIGRLWVDRTTTERIEALFCTMAESDYAASTIHHAWLYLNQACVYGVRHRKVKRNPVADVLLPEAKPPRRRKSFTIEQLKPLLFDAIPQDSRPAMWITGLMCGLRPGELTGLRWPFVDIDSEDPSIDVLERANELNHKYVGQAPVKIVKRATRAAGLVGDYASHSLRAGFVSDALDAGATREQVQRHGRWSDITSLDPYYRKPQTWGHNNPSQHLAGHDTG